MSTPEAGLPPLFTADDLGTWLGEALDPGDARATQLIGFVSAIVRRVAGQEWTDGVPTEVLGVALEVAKRAWRNPDGYTSERIGDYSYQLPDGSGGLTVTAAEQLLLEGFRTRRNAGLWTLQTTRDRDDPDTGWVPVEGALYPFPWYAL